MFVLLQGPMFFTEANGFITGDGKDVERITKMLEDKYNQKFIVKKNFLVIWNI